MTSHSSFLTRAAIQRCLLNVIGRNRDAEANGQMVKGRFDPPVTRSWNDGYLPIPAEDRSRHPNRAFGFATADVGVGERTLPT
jgi:hypothetical protein